MKDNLTKEELRKAKRDSNLCREATDYFVEVLKGLGWEVKNLIRQNGYFIFTFGGNTVNIFQIKGLEAWRFGLWWTVIDENDKLRINGEFFCQFETDVDKFKPSRSHFLITFTIPTNKRKTHIVPDDTTFEYSGINELLLYLKHHKIYAWAESEAGAKCEFRVPFSRFKAFRRYISHRFYQWKSEKYHNWANRKLCKFLSRKVLPAFEGGFIHHYSNMSPEYEMVIPLSKNTKLFRRRGFYSVFGLEESDKEGTNLPENWVRYCEKEPKIHERWKKLEKRYRKLAKFFGIWYYGGVADDVLVVCNKAYRELQEGKINL